MRNSGRALCATASQAGRFSEAALHYGNKRRLLTGQRWATFTRLWDRLQHELLGVVECLAWFEHSEDTR